MTYNELVQAIQEAGESGVRVDTAELLAGKCLYVMSHISATLALADKDRRMRKRGVKAIRSAIYLEECLRGEKKPTEATIEARININEIVQAEEEASDNSEVTKEELQRQYDIASEAHLFFRGISKQGSYNG